MTASNNSERTWNLCKTCVKRQVPILFIYFFFQYTYILKEKISYKCISTGLLAIGASLYEVSKAQFMLHAVENEKQIT